ncbi:stage V sporulation protein AD [Marinicrinis sediminis]|uniref:Stage V sporulation protein AD n=1 Tax=Marinicrinis sediminis TaxID=1652465 RepID=A0ABW5R9H5_9BACL
MLQGEQSWIFERKPVIVSTATVVGPEEGKGPIAGDFDIIHEDMMLEESSWEKAERKMMEEAARLAVKKGNLSKGQVEFYVGGDLMNQIISSSFAARELSIPYIGVFGACSTSMESLALAALMVNSGAANTVLAGTCSHNCSAEKQFRYPTEYGSQKPPTAQFTVTGAAASIVRAGGVGPVVTSATIGKVLDLGITDPFNMGAAMAPAAVNTIQAHLKDLNRDPSYYDLIVTGDLATVGKDIALELFQEKNISMASTVFDDCGLMIFDRETQSVQSGGSGCACSGVVTYAHLLKKMKEGELRKILVVATGALLSPVSYQQGESIPCIAHAVSIEHKGGTT